MLMAYTARRYLHRPPAETRSDETLELYLRECCWTISPVLKQRGERQRESSESMLMFFLSRERSLAVRPRCHTGSTLKMTFQSISDTDGSHPISLRRRRNTYRRC